MGICEYGYLNICLVPIKFRKRKEMMIMTDRCAVMTTLNGEMVEWKVFDSPAQAMPYYVSGMSKLQRSLKSMESDGRWEIMLCQITQYALSR
ncbi:MAG: hypothetical protein A4E30_01063 [Methanomassiliicoccales archaeon PtaB.Bin215]|nr:MAG: hypothetical protein A4E30_01063 [Methanomassiliicoccales archaeon PtaB.Bin215]